MMKKRVLSAVLAAMMLTATACGETDLPLVETAYLDDTTVAESVSTRDKSDLPDSYDLGGYNMRVLMMTVATNTTGATSMYVVAPDEANGEILNDTIYNRNIALYAKYNFTVENIYADNVLNTLEQSVLAGDDEYDMALPYFDKAAQKVDTGIFLDLNTVKNLNLKKNYWDRNFLDSIALDGKNYFAVGDMMVADDDVLMMILYNRDLADDLGIENLYEAVYDGRWTYELMRKYVKQVASDLDGDGKLGKDDMIGYLYANNNCTAAHMAAADTSIFVKDNDGMPVMNTNLENAYKIFEIITELHDQSRYGLEWLQFGSDQVNVITTLVSNKKVLFQNMVLSQLRRLYRDVTADFGMLPMPKLTEEQENYQTTLWKSFEAITIPATNQNADKTGFVLEALSAASGDVNNAYYNVCLSSKYTRDAESFDMIEIARQNVMYDIEFVYDWGGLYTAINSACGQGNNNLASLIESGREAAVTEAKSFIGKLQ